MYGDGGDEPHVVYVEHRRTVDPANIIYNGRRSRSRVFCVTGTFCPPARLPARLPCACLPAHEECLFSALLPLSPSSSSSYRCPTLSPTAPDHRVINAAAADIVCFFVYVPSECSTRVCYICCASLDECEEFLVYFDR